MSSILEALKKVEQASGENHPRPLPWSSAAPRSRGKSRSIRWWGWGLGSVAVAGLGLFAFWSFDQPARTAPVVTTPAPPRMRVPSGSDAALSRKTSAAQPPTAFEPVRTSTPVPAKERMPIRPNPVSAFRPDAAVPATRPPAAVTPVPPPVPITSANRVFPPIRSTEQAALDSTAIDSDGSPPIPDPPVVQRPVEQAPSAGDVDSSAEGGQKNFRDDPRVELQALVWAPESSQRFVLVNNRLIREGGSVDNLVVVAINRDDVLFAEGGERWHQKFNIR